MVKTPKPLPVGTLFLFKLKIPSLPEPLVLNGEVRWIVREGEERPRDPEGNERDASAAGMGIRFIYQDETQREAVERTVEALMISHLGQLIYARLKSQ